MSPAKSPQDSAPRFFTASGQDEHFTEERCAILELWNDPADPAVSVARVRVAAGVTTALHGLAATAERYLVLAGVGRMEVGEARSEVVRPGDLVYIPEDCPQRITNLGESDLTFLAICTPRFVPEIYRDLESHTGD